ncbi:MAG: hypothetical protein ACRYG7_24855 [Janthinobacterium lividum]
MLTGAYEEEVGPSTDALITGYDSRYCGCCGGLMVTFTGNANPASGFKLIDNFTDLGLSPTEIFPLQVKIAYVDLPEKCGGNHIKVTKLQRQ